MTRPTRARGASRRCLALIAARIPRLVVGLVVALAAACGGEGEGETSTEDGGDEGPVALWDHLQWQDLGVADDPLAEHRPGAVNCSPLAWGTPASVDGPELDVETGDCNYLALVQPVLADVAVGDTIRFSFRHFDLTSPEPAEGHLAIVLDGNVLVEVTREIPGPAAVEDLEWESTVDAPAGAPLVVHLHNHGQNSWIFSGLTRERPL